LPKVIAGNPANRARLMAIEPQRFIGVMEAWRRAFNEGADHPVIGLRPAALRSLTMPAPASFPAMTGYTRASPARRRIG
jgi:hypothetical protein